MEGKVEEEKQWGELGLQHCSLTMWEPRDESQDIEVYYV